MSERCSFHVCICECARAGQLTLEGFKHSRLTFSFNLVYDVYLCMSTCKPWHTYRSQEDMLCVNLLLPPCLRQTLQSPPSSCCRCAGMAYMCYCTQALRGFWKFRLWPSDLCGEYLPWCLIILSHYKLQASNIQKN